MTIKTKIQTRSAIVAVLAAALVPLAHGQGRDGSVRVVVSSDVGDRLSTKAPLAFRSGAKAPGAAITVDESVTYQTIDGFGATFNEAGMIALNRLDEVFRERAFRDLFDPERGAGFSLMAAPMAACDFASAGRYYSYDGTEGDVELRFFSIERDLQPNGLIPYIRKARQYGRFQLQTKPDFPPVWMMEEYRENGKLRMTLKPEHYGTFSRYVVKYIKAYEEQGVAIDAFSPFNEPQHVYCRIKYPQIRDLIRDHLGPAFAAAGLKTKIQTSDTNNRETAIKEIPLMLQDPGARRYISAVAAHGYDWEDHGSTDLGKLHEKFPDVPIWMTEVCYMKESTLTKKPTPIREFEDGDWWGRMIVDDLRNWVSGWIYWNMVLDQTGGPWLASKKPYNFEINNQHPVVIADTQKQEVVYTGLYYYLAHFSKFVRPGSVRIKAEGAADGLSFVAFRAPNGQKVLQVINSRKVPAEFAIVHRGRTAAAVLPAISIGTYAWE